MPRQAREIANPRTGQRMRFLLTAADTNGALLRIETRNPPNAIAEPMHVHPRQETRCELLSGTLQFVVGGHQRRLAPGDTIAIPAGTPHRFWNDSDTDAVAIQEARPALRLAEFFETDFQLAAEGQLDEHGRPSLLHSAILGPEFADEIRLVNPPWPIQCVVYTLLAPIARLRGYEPRDVARPTGDPTPS
ncbi:MAG: cupin domain-containing protein [Solirubrobacteraceae bacterium]